MKALLFSMVRKVDQVTSLKCPIARAGRLLKSTARELDKNCSTEAGTEKARVWACKALGIFCSGQWDLVVLRD